MGRGCGLITNSIEFILYGTFSGLSPAEIKAIEKSTHDLLTNPEVGVTEPICFSDFEEGSIVYTATFNGLGIDNATFIKNIKNLINKEELVIAGHLVMQLNGDMIDYGEADFIVTTETEFAIGDGTRDETDSTVTLNKSDWKDNDFDEGTLKGVVILNNVTSIGDSAFMECSELTYVDLSNTNLLETIGDRAFRECSSLVSVVIPNSVTSIGDFAFRECSILAEVTLTNASLLKTIGVYAFYLCAKLISVVIPNSVTEIGTDAFRECSSMTYVNLSNANLLDTIGDRAFYLCVKLEEVYIPDSVTSIGQSAFYSCSSLTSITVGSGNQKYSSDDNGVLFNKDKTLLIQYPIGNSASSYTIPSTVTEIGEDAFSSCAKLTSVDFSNATQLETIRNGAFYKCVDLTSVVIPNSVTSIEAFAFTMCYKLKMVTFKLNPISSDPELVLQPNTFSGTLVTESFTFKVHETDNVTYNDTNKTTTINRETADVIVEPPPPPSGVSVKVTYTKTNGQDVDVNVSNPISLSWYEFAYINPVITQDNIVSWEVTRGGDKYTHILPYAFRECAKLTSVDISEFITSIGRWAFGGCSLLASVTLSNANQLKTIGRSAFWSCFELTSVTLTNASQLKTIGNYAFYACVKLTSVVIPDSVTFIGEEAFGECYDLTNISVEDNNLHYSSDEYGVLFNHAKTTLIQCPAGNSEGTYIIPDGVIKIGVWSFSLVQNLVNVTIPASVTSIGTYAFYHERSFVNLEKKTRVLTSVSFNLSTETTLTFGTYAWYDVQVMEGITDDTVRVDRQDRALTYN
jgi:hypothetical protein